MIVGFPPFHSNDNKNLERRIIAGKVRFPSNINADAQDLIEWLLEKDPDRRPQEFSEIKQHPFLNDIHWGKVSTKCAIPPWVPDLYSTHVSKKQLSIPLSQVFHKNTFFKETNRASYNNRQHLTENLQNSLYVVDHKSNREQRKLAEINETIEDRLYLDGKRLLCLYRFMNVNSIAFDSMNESEEEKYIRIQLNANEMKQTPRRLLRKERSSKTKCSENYVISFIEDLSDGNCSVDSEGGANSMHEY